MYQIWMNANLPWVAVLIAAFVVARIVLWLSNGQFRIKRLATIHHCEQGSAQSLSFVLTLPFFMMILMLIVQVCQIMVANILVHQAAFAAVRSASVWIPANVGSVSTEDFYFNDFETANRISSFRVLQRSEEGIQYRIESDLSSEKYRKIKQAAVLAISPMAPSRDLGYQLNTEGQQTATALAKLYAGLDFDSTSNNLIETRLRNKLAYAEGNTTVQLDFWHRWGPLVNYQQPPLQRRYFITRDEFFQNEVGWQDHLTAQVTFNLALLPGPMRFFAENVSTVSVNTSSNSSSPIPDRAGNCACRPSCDGFGRTDATGQTFVFPVTASATMLNNGEKPLLRYLQEEF